MRWVAGKSTWDALGELSPSLADSPLRDGLRQWVVALTQARIGSGEELARAQASGERSGHYAGEPPREVNWREAWGGLVAARSAIEGMLWLEAAAELASPIADAQRLQSARQLEVTRRFGRAHPWQATWWRYRPTPYALPRSSFSMPRRTYGGQSRAREQRVTVAPPLSFKRRSRARPVRGGRARLRVRDG